MKAGLVSVTFRSLEPRAVAELARRCGLSGVEWGGDVHAPHGDLEAARQVLELSRAAGLEVAAYGSYYRAGESESQGLSWARVLASAQAMQAPLVRVWAGKRGSQEADAAYFRGVTGDLRRICQASQTPVACEFHGGTLCDSGQAALQVLEAVAHPNLKMLWQPANGASIAARLSDLRAVKPHLANLHVFQWGPGGGGDKRSLGEGRAQWQQYLSEAGQDDADRWALLEFVRGDEPAQLERDAGTLLSWLAQQG